MYPITMNLEDGGGVLTIWSPYILFCIINPAILSVRFEEISGLGFIRSLNRSSESKRISAPCGDSLT